MTNHPIHVHGTQMFVTCTDGGWVPESARWPEVTADVPVGAMRAVECVFEDSGDWSFHCHKSHHTMGPMGHAVPTMIGVDQRDLVQKIRSLVPDYMIMGDTGMAEMSEMQMAIPENTLPMMTGTGPFGPIEMGGMFTTIKVRENLAAGDYRDPGWYEHPPGSVAHEWQGDALAEVRQDPKVSYAPAAPRLSNGVRRPDGIRPQPLVVHRGRGSHH